MKFTNGWDAERENLQAIFGSSCEGLDVVTDPVVLGFGTADNAVVITTNTDQSARTGYVTVYYTK